MKGQAFVIYHVRSVCFMTEEDSSPTKRHALDTVKKI
jgi:hypothetical protein